MLSACSVPAVAGLPKERWLLFTCLLHGACALRGNSLHYCPRALISNGLLFTDAVNTFQRQNLYLDHLGWYCSLEDMSGDSLDCHNLGEGSANME